MRKTLVVLVALPAVLLFQAAPGGGIVGGQVDTTHPEVGAIVVNRPHGVGPLCTGVLISPTVFLTAAHCFTREDYRVTFASPFDKDSKVHVGTFHPHPQFRFEPGHSPYDIAVIVFGEGQEVTDIAPAQLPVAGLLDSMKKARTLMQETGFTAVGYGFQGYENEPGGQQPWPGGRTRRSAVSTFDALDRDYLHLSQNAATGDGGTCAGDSGGPNYLGAGSTETDVVAGITITGDLYCKATNVPLRLDTRTSREFLDDFVALP